MYEFLYSLADAVGMVGVVLILIAYFLLSMGRWAADGLAYQILNFIGAWLMLYSLYFHWNFSAVVIEIAWVGISIVGIYRAMGFVKKKIANN